MKRCKLSLIAMILGIIVSIFFIYSLFESNAQNSAEKFGESLGKAIVMPSALALIAATILNIIGYFNVNRTITLISAILYTVSLILFPMWGFGGIPSMILQYIAYAKMKKNEEI